jgi:hypothetical protein
MKNVVFWDVTPLVFLRSVLQFLVAANVVPKSLMLFTLWMETIRSSETSVLAKATRRHIPDDGILHRHGVTALKISNLT